MNGRARSGIGRHSRTPSGGENMSRSAYASGKVRGTLASRTAIICCALLIAGVFVTGRWINKALMSSTVVTTTMLATEKVVIDIVPMRCPKGNQTSCSSTARLPTTLPPPNSAMPSCPEYFRWIHKDLRPWMSTGITKAMVEHAALTANFRLVVIDGRVYVHQYEKSFQTRDVFTIWGILQLLRRYPGRIPDLDLMFDCVDWPVIMASDYQGGRNASILPPLFRYCSNETSLDIVFPDWSFWGWPEINIKPWGALSKELKEGNRRVKWLDREPYAYWKGNPEVAPTRQDLLKCNVSEGREWNARLYSQNWLTEIKKGFKDSDLSRQCTHRYKIYIEGSAWSVSEKYILACDSVPLLVRPIYYDFFTRGLMPLQHYWPIRNDNKCWSIKYAVDWGNSHKKKAQAIGKEASNFIQEQLKLDYVYDYMFHLLNEYAKLLTYKPTVPPEAEEVCVESMACPATGIERKFMMESMVNASIVTGGPCFLPPPYTPEELEELQRKKSDNIKQVETSEEKAQKSSEKSKL